MKTCVCNQLHVLKQEQARCAIDVVANVCQVYHMVFHCLAQCSLVIDHFEIIQTGAFGFQELKGRLSYLFYIYQLEYLCMY